ncbi:MAG: hypothetical protein EOO88_38295, partial [Pedobacter sp.]
MATLEEQLALIDQEIELAIGDKDARRTVYFTIEYCRTLYNTAIDLMNIQQYQEAVDLYKEAGKLARNFKPTNADAIGATTDPSEDSIEMLYEELKQFELLSEAYEHFSEAQQSSLSRNPGVAATFFEKGEKSFFKVYELLKDEQYKFRSRYCHAMQLYTEALEDLARTNFAASRAKFQRSYLALENLINQELVPFYEKEENNDNGQQVSLYRSDYLAIKSYYHISEGKYQFGTRNFKNAEKQFLKAAEVMKEAHDNYKQHLPSSITFLQLGENSNYLGWASLSAAEIAREDEKWSLANDSYEKVRTYWEHAAGYYVQSGLPQAIALQDVLLNQLLNIDVYQNQCEKEQELSEKVKKLELQINELQTKIGDALKSTGITINNNTEVITSVQQNAEFIVQIEMKAREQVSNLLGALDESNLA